MPIEVVLFDYSGVLTTALGLPEGEVDFDTDAAFVEMAAALAATEAHPWHELERGEISLESFIADVEARVPGVGQLFALGSELNVMANLEILPERLALAADLKQRGMRVGVVSNNVAEWQPYWLPTLPAGLFEIVIDSAAVGCRKPEPAIYQLAMERLGVKDPTTVLFIDDFAWNVDGATAVGMVGLHCTPDVDLRTTVLSLL